MEEKDKIAIIDLLINQPSSEEFEKRKEELMLSEDGNLLWKKYSKTINSIELLYARKAIAEELKDCTLDQEEDEQGISNERISDRMKTKPNNWIQYPIMIVVSIIISWIVFSILSKPTEEKETETNTTEEVKPIKEEADNAIITDEVVKGTDIMGLALNRTGFYILPYSVTSLKGVFGSTGNMTNKLPLSIVWDDEEYGLAIANFADINFERLSNLPYQFSKSDNFIGEELFFVFSTKSEVKINKGLVIEDNSESYKMKVHLSLATDVYGAVVLNNAGLIVGICEMPEDDGTATVIKSKAILRIIKDMNLDKGVSYISLSSNNYLRNKSNAKRIENLKPFMSWYSTD